MQFLAFLVPFLISLSVFSTPLPSASSSPPLFRSPQAGPSPRKTYVLSQSQRIGPHGGQILEDREHQFEVKLDPEHNQMSIYTLRSQTPLPSSLSVILTQDRLSGRTLELQAVDPHQALPRYEAQLSSSQISIRNDSFIGITLLFGIG